jgi:hypothetical protein
MKRDMIIINVRGVKIGESHSDNWKLKAMTSFANSIDAK